MKCGAVNRSKVGNSISGDTYVFAEDEQQTLVAVVDGLGAGEAAHEAAERARLCIGDNTRASLTDLLQLCHQALRGTRGAVMMLMRVDHTTDMVSFAGVGNVSVRVIGDAAIKPISRNGIVGYRMTSVREFRYPYTRGDVFILHSDGISTRFTVDEDWVRCPQTDLDQVAREIADQFGKDDDVTIVVIR